MDDASFFLVIRLGPKTSVYQKNVTVVCAVTGCDVTNNATTLHGLNKHNNRDLFESRMSVGGVENAFLRKF